MRLLSVLMFFALGIMVLVSSCGKDHDDPSPLPTGPQPVDSIPSDWLKAKTPNDTTHLIDIFFANNTTGYAVGATGEVWKSADGGLSWSSVFQVPDKRGGYNLAVTANGKVYIVFNYGGSGIYTSADGAAFQYQPVGGIGTSPDVYFTGNDTGYISSGYGTVNNIPVTGLWQTTDGGTQWQLVPVAGSKISSVSNDFSFYNPVYGYVIDNDGVSRTGGQYNQWSAPVFVTSTFLSSIAAPAANIAYAASYRGVIYKSTDGGASFAATDTLPLTTSSATYINLRFPNLLTGYATTPNVLYKTTDGGFTWLPTLTSKNALDEVHFTDAGHGWVCGNKGTILVYRP